MCWWFRSWRYRWFCWILGGSARGFGLASPLFFWGSSGFSAVVLVFRLLAVLVVLLRVLVFLRACLWFWLALPLVFGMPGGLLMVLLVVVANQQTSSDAILRPVVDHVASWTTWTLAHRLAQTKSWERNLKAEHLERRVKLKRKATVFWRT